MKEEWRNINWLHLIQPRKQFGLAIWKRQLVIRRYRSKELIRYKVNVYWSWGVLQREMFLIKR